MTSTIVIGGGLGGLVAARGLNAAGHDVTVVEAAERFGGQIQTVEFCGLPVDIGAEAMFLGAPPLKELVTELGLLDAVVGPRAGTSWLHRGRRLTKLPEGVGPTGPTKIMPVLKSGLLGPFALARAGLEPLMARKISQDISVGDFVARRFGRAVADTFVDPLLGNLHAGDIHRLSLHATAPQLRPAAAEGRSILRAARPSGGAGGLPMFATFPQGLQLLIDSLVSDLERRGVGVHANSRVTHLTRENDRWCVHATSGYQYTDRIVLTAGSPAIEELVRPHVPEAADLLASTERATVATILLAYPRETIGRLVRDANGLLLNSTSGRLVKAATFSSQKWEHLDGDDVFVIRASVGRAGSDVLDITDDDHLAKRVHRELAELTDLTSRPVATRVTRWPDAYPQLQVGHLDRMARARSALQGTGLFVGAGSVDGLGLPSVIRSAKALVDAVR